MPFTGTSRFQILDKLGEGGMGVVYDVYDRERGMRVALKYLRRVNDSMGLYRFKREFRALSNLSHPNIITLYELISVGEEWYFTMELIEGVDVLHYVRTERSGELEYGETVTGASLLDTATQIELNVGASSALSRPRGERVRAPSPTPTSSLSTTTTRITEGLALPPIPARRTPISDIVSLDRMRDALAQLASALDALHAADMIHRDLKPANVRVTREGRVVLMDFGVVVEMQQPHSLERKGSAVGTPAFMAPEQSGDDGRPTAAVDWYAFGVLLYLAMTQRLPFEGTVMQVLDTKRSHDPLPPRVFTEGVPPDLERLCMALLDRDPARRPGGAEVLDRLGRGGPRKVPSLVEPTLDLGGRPFVGRARELGELRRSFDEACEQGGGCVIVAGPSGIGKSSLVERFLRELRIRRMADDAPAQTSRTTPVPLILSGRCHERETLPFKAFDGVIDALVGALIQLSEERRAELLPEDLRLLERMFPVLRRLSNSEAQRRADPPPLEMRGRAFQALRALLASLAATRPVVVQIEDLQWADEESLKLMRALLTPPVPVGLLVLTTIRSRPASAEDQDEGMGRVLSASDIEAELGAEVCRSIALPPLTAEEQRALVSRLGRGVSPAAEFWDQAMGHPMLLVELARMAEETPGVAEHGGALRLEDILHERVQRMPAQARALLEAVAVAGTPTPLRVLGVAAELSSSDTERAVALLRIGQFVHTYQSGLEPWIGAYHDKIREALVSRAEAEHTAALHRRLAEALEDWRQAPPGLLARHWHAAGEVQRAAECALEAARQAAHTLAFERASAFYRQVVEYLADSADGEATSALRCRAWLGLAEDLRVLDRTDEALALLERVESEAQNYELTSELAALYYMRGNLLFPRGDLDGCMAAHAQARVMAKRAGSPEREAQALSGLGDAYYIRGEMRAAHEYFDACIALCRAHGFVEIEVANLAMRGITRYYDQNDLSSALRDGMDAVTAAAWIGHTRAEIVARNGCVGWFLTEMGRFEEATREFETARAAARRLGARRFEPNSLNWLAKIAYLQGRRDEAAELAQRSLAVCRETSFAFVGPMALAVVALTSRDEQTRLEALAEGERILAQGSASHNYLYFYRDGIDALLAAGDFERALRYADALEAYPGGEVMKWCRFFAQRARLLCAAGQGELSEELREELSRLRTQARVIGLFTAARALDEALRDA
ncbi:serine/threonine-protein kinase PknK [Haliangium ochraceum]|uniref:Serine/threonine protein kinase n=1 Tax=Haliangium ochraceum (strain DSM 14365 / JCM 11303 / SMP-2) TaxID=502025 RepID=D0LYB2_HALO1|nr:serine/threonine-protein kinase [Haliangium ochraceum]ACY16262.1 serine/threonine protein kinase [Haliangium ochraceum DSM 14365]